ncbi:lipoic acid synthetase [Halanaerobium saccharolyticum]|jgi:lipoic acid synthetase|uniref:Lipoyl synthase n=1 Tax=Halanaerobium saccharolyticum TaxID=43595 RepID=A0A2T5RRJ6_9FIRM|nr:lipoyl synthase [Halanaerobium saccharolyticum]PTW02780.1 lipoic acid synthetase [Halanaerobium saccharolyticum]PUU90276.1 MAG: lipoic acid synthetase [Halanaerobium sp.]
MSKRKRLPKWLRNKDPLQKGMLATRNMLKNLELNTVCQSARCPNIGECYSKKTATFMILGQYCTRNCRFCSVTHHRPEAVEPEEAVRVAEAVEKLKLKHAVITSVTRDDLEDGGAEQFVRVINAIRERRPEVSVEVLTPDFNNDQAALEKIIKARPEIFNHNVETVPSLYEKVRPQADYQQSLAVLNKVAASDPDILIKSGMMLGLGESEEELNAVWKDLLQAGVEILTMGQYLQPTNENIEVAEYIRPEKFAELKEKALALGFKSVSSGPHVRSSYLAEETYQELNS